MSKFDLDDVLKDLGDPLPEAPEERAPAQRDPQPPTPGSASNESLSSLYEPEEDASEDQTDFGERLIKRGIVDLEQLDTARRMLRQAPGKTIAAVLMEMGADEHAIQEVVAECCRLPFERIEADRADAFDARALKRLGAEYCKVNAVLPLRYEGSRLVVGTASPDDVFRLDHVKRKLKVASIKHVLVSAGDIRNIVEMLTEVETEEYDIDELLTDVEEDDVEVLQDELDEADVEDAESSPVVRFVNHIIQTAVRDGASDVHIEPDERALRVRFRIDGVLFDVMSPPKRMHAAMTSRIKIMSNLDIAERRLPQDGRIRATVLGRKLDLRVSTIPTPSGEKTVMRILDTRSINVTLDQLGFAPDTMTIWKNQISQPHGILLVTGPTGSGKTTTLYSSIRQMNIRKLNVSTVEDPVEYNLSGITQIQTHERIGMTFAAALRALLRQDPDVIMLGEIRDQETATIAVQAALTGHLVLSTLHTNDAPSSITRLINIGMEPFLIGAALNGVLAQRLVRKICQHCKTDIPIKEDMADFLTMHGVTASTVAEGKGCLRCRETGYSGRLGLFELLILDDHLRDAISRSPNVAELRRTCTERGMVTLREDGFQKVAGGLTTVEEILRVTEATI